MDIDKELSIIKRGVSEIISESQLKEKIQKSRKNNLPLKIKAGFDPTAPDIHLGHTVILHKLRQFQDLGHIVYFLIGDFTGRIGDPTGQSKVRRAMTEEEVKSNAKTYEAQVYKILDESKTKIVFNSEWFSAMNGFEFGDLFTRYTVSRLIERDDFSSRLKAQKPVFMSEFIYPLLQGYDSVKLNADVELGGTDQKFNMIVGRDLQESYGQEPQVVITLPLLEGLDGENKMSKSLNNYIGINEPPKDIFGKIMSISDELMIRYYELLTDIDMQLVKKAHPRDSKINLAKTILEQYFGKEEAQRQEDEFNSVFSKKNLPIDMAEFKIPKDGEKILKILLESKLVASGNESRRLINQGAVTFNNEKISSEDFLVTQDGILKVGSRRFLKISKKSK